MKILFRQRGEASTYAAEELAKYYARMTGETAPGTIPVDDVETPVPGTIRLGLLSDFHRPAEDLSDPMLEDILDIDVGNGEGIIAGSNERSILMGVYRYLRSAGCRWLRPGEDGEFIPKADLSHHSFTFRKKADLIFRGECSEGAIAYEHMRDTVLWMPKVGMNMFMIEGLVPYTYMHKWYAHVGNRKLHIPDDVTDYGMLERQIARLEKDIVRTGIQFHNVGHGWMFETMGVHHGSPAMEKAGLKEEYKQYLAEVKGVRDLYEGDTFYTHFCYSNPKARKFLVDFWVDYAQRKPYVDFFHIWLADASNNQCECEECRKREPSDWYVLLLNEIDEALTKIGNHARLVLILYVDLNRPPKTLKLKHPERFVLLQACGGNYQKGYEAWEPYAGEEPPYVRNDFQGVTFEIGQKWRGDWNRLHDGKMKNCLYEYRFYTDHYADPGYMQVAREVNRDMKMLPAMRYDGNMSDQTSRNCLPTGLPMSILAETMFDLTTDYETFTQGYMKDSFGADAGEARAFLERVTDLFDPELMRSATTAAGLEEVGVVLGEDNTVSRVYNSAYKKKLEEIPALVEKFAPVIERNLTLPDPAQRKSWEYLKLYCPILIALADAYAADAAGDRAGAQERIFHLEDVVSESEMRIHSVFDFFLFDRYHRLHMGLPMVPYFH